MAHSDRKLVFELEDNLHLEETKSLWVFGYGSLCWNPGFPFGKAVTGYIRGYSRKFWQGNTTHRGTEDKPGRVATLVEDEESLVYGIAFQISGEAAVPYLTKRECKLGGYAAEFTTFYPTSSGIPFEVILYIATPSNSLWLGDATLGDIASQIVECCGPSGHNAEYLLRLADFVHCHFPGEQDEHLFGLEVLVRTSINDRGLCIEMLMGDSKNCVSFVRRRSNASDGEDQEERVESFQFTTRVPGKTLRCLNI